MSDRNSGYNVSLSQAASRMSSSGHSANSSSGSKGFLTVLKCLLGQKGYEGVFSQLSLTNAMQSFISSISPNNAMSSFVPSLKSFGLFGRGR